MRICVIGNSHLAALKQAWDQLTFDYREIELVFFGARASAMTHLEVQNGCLVPTNEETRQDIYFTSGGQSLIDINGFDAVLLYGLACDTHIFSPALATHRVGNIADTTRKIMSLSCFTRICEDRVRRSLMFKIASLVRSVSGVPIFISPSPFPSRSCVEDTSGKWNILAANYCQPIQQGYYDGINRAFQSFEGIFLPQPGDTVTDFLFTKTQFSKGSIRLIEGLSSAHPDDDYNHMNKDYGNAFLIHALAIMASKSSINTQQDRLLSMKHSIAAVDRFMACRTTQNQINGQIPPTIFQYWDSNPPNQIVTLLERNRFLCKQSNIHYVLFNDHDARNCLKAYFSEDVYQAYDLSPHPAMKCDLLRLCYLYKYGGFYLDADMVLTEKFNELFSIKGELAVFKWDTHDRTGICNWLMGSVPDSQAIKFAIDATTASILGACKTNPDDILKNTLAISGPGLFTRAIGSFIAQKENHAAEFCNLPFSIERVADGHLLVQNGPGFLKKPLKYKSTDLHWSVAAKKTPKTTANTYLKMLSDSMKIWK